MHSNVDEDKCDGVKLWCKFSNQWMGELRVITRAMQEIMHINMKNVARLLSQERTVK